MIYKHPLMPENLVPITTGMYSDTKKAHLVRIGELSFIEPKTCLSHRIDFFLWINSDQRLKNFVLHLFYLGNMLKYFSA